MNPYRFPDDRPRVINAVRRDPNRPFREHLARLKRDEEEARSQVTVAQHDLKRAIQEEAEVRATILLEDVSFHTDQVEREVHQRMTRRIASLLEGSRIGLAEFERRMQGGGYMSNRPRFWTTTISAGKTASEIGELIRKYGCKRYMVEWDDDGDPLALQFWMKAPNIEQEIPVSLRAQTDAILRRLGNGDEARAKRVAVAPAQGVDRDVAGDGRERREALPRGVHGGRDAARRPHRRPDVRGEGPAVPRAGRGGLMQTTTIRSPRQVTMKRGSPFRVEVEIINENGSVDEFVFVSTSPLRVNGIRRYDATHTERSEKP